MLRIIFYAILFVSGIYFSSNSLYSQEEKSKYYFKDSTDMAIDISGFLSTRIGFMPVPMIITEPAVGYGAGLGMVFFHRSKEERESGKFSKLPPSLSMAGGLYTENGTWAAIIAHQGSYRKDHIRYLGVLGYTNVNLDFYGAGLIQEERAYRFNLAGFLLFQELAIRIKDSPFFIGANYSYFNNEITFKTELEVPGLEELSENSTIGGVNLLMMWETRDNIFTPNKGIFTAFELGKYAPWLGGENDFNNANLRFYGYTNKIRKTVAGFRFNGQYKWGDVPFYALPFISMRGIPAMRYQGDVVALGETEWRWNAYRRWSLVGFAGAGFAAENVQSFQLNDAKIAYGTGFRYFIARQYGMHAGIDFAWGPENFAWYITFGSAWSR